MFNKYIKKIIVLAVFMSFSNVVLANADEEENKYMEKINRTMFSFNMTLDKYFFKPVALGYRYITNQYTRDRVSNFIGNIYEPVYAINHLLQGEFSDSMSNVGRFGANTTLGLAGTYDVAGNAYNLGKKNTGFDETLSFYCVPDGPFLMLPIIGPNTPRSVTGRVVDHYSNPIIWAVNNDKNYSAKILYPFAFMTAISIRERNIELLDNLMKDSLDPYTMTKSAYLQNRTKLKSCIFSDKQEASTSYDFNFDEDSE